MSYIKFFEDISKADIKEAGGKGASLGEITKAGLPVPPGFVIMVEAYRKFSGGRVSIDFRKEILNAFDQLGAKRVAVRSSAIAEDSKTASWAGQLESYLNVTREGLIKNIRKCWDSIKSERVLIYAAEKKIPKEKLAVAAVVQKMVQSEISGVCFTVNPATRNKNQVIVEAVRGLGESLVQGKVTPDSYVIEKNGLRILDINVVAKETRKLSDKQIKELVKTCIKIESHYGSPQDIEWAFAKGKFYIVQSRPITTL